jgi:hypothetical protein
VTFAHQPRHRSLAEKLVSAPDVEIYQHEVVEEHLATFKKQHDNATFKHLKQQVRSLNQMWDLELEAKELCRTILVCVGRNAAAL